MCGIVAIVYGDSTQSCYGELLEGLCQLQHRGQDGCGIVTAVPSAPGRYCGGTGLIHEVFHPSRGVSCFPGSIGIGHARYPTSGSLSDAELQPIASKGAHEIFLAHNGHITHANDAEGLRRVHNGSVESATSDSQILLATLAAGLENANGLVDRQIDASSLVAALRHVYANCKGSFASVAMIDSRLMVGFRDAYGIKPLVFGRRTNADGTTDFAFASESVALHKLSFDDVEDLKPGQAVFIDHATPKSQVVGVQVAPCLAYAPDMFEYVYFARPESVMDGISVHECRQRMGQALGELVATRLRALGRRADVVIPVPETAFVSAMAAAQQMRVPFAFGLTKTRYSSRSFIVAGQKQRLQAIQRKLGVVESEFRGRDVVIIDDSVVRGGTSREIIKMARRAGAKTVVLASASPPIRYNHMHGIDLAEPKELIAYGRSESEIGVAIGADLVIYLPLEKLLQACMASRRRPDTPTSFEVGVFAGIYVDGGATTTPAAAVPTSAAVSTPALSHSTPRAERAKRCITVV